MPRVSQPTIVAFLSAAMGVVVTLLLAAMFINKGPTTGRSRTKIQRVACSNRTPNEEQIQRPAEFAGKASEIHGDP